MTRRKFYQVPKAGWLYASKTETPSNHEEPVRQWCLQELIRAYGVMITDIGFEAKAKVGSKTYRIDILVEREGKPWIVVECKRAEHADHQKAMEQAISYAEAPRINAEFAVYTNGDVWHVRRRMDTGWVPVIDLPMIGCFAANHGLVDHLRVLEDIQPILYKLNSPIAGSEAARLLLAMQKFFNGSHSWCHAQDQGLLDAADNVLRVLAVPSLHLDYRFGKLVCAAKRLNAYAERRGLDVSLIHVDSEMELSYALRCASTHWQQLTRSSTGLDAADGPLIRLIGALLDYGQTLPLAARKYPPITPAIHTRLREYLDSTLIIHLGLHLPDVSDELLTADLRGYCKSAWLDFKMNE